MAVLERGCIVMWLWAEATDRRSSYQHSHGNNGQTEAQPLERAGLSSCSCGESASLPRTLAHWDLSSAPVENLLARPESPLGTRPHGIRYTAQTFVRTHRAAH